MKQNFSRITGIAFVMATLLCCPVLADGSQFGDCPATGAFCYLSSNHFKAGDTCTISVDACNNDPAEPLEACMIVALEVYGQYFFWPAWTGSLDFNPIIIPACSCSSYIIFDFPWPEEFGSPGSVTLIAALLDCDDYELLGIWTMCQFGWG